MGRRAVLVAVFVVVVVGVCPCAFGDLVAFSYDYWALYELDVTTMQTTKIGDLDIPHDTDLACMARASDTSAYLVDRTQNVLYTVGLTDASTLASVQLDSDMWCSGRGLDLSPTGALYGVFGGQELRSIDPLTGQTSPIATLESPHIESIAFSPDGTLYAGDTDKDPPRTLASIDVGGGNMVDIADLGLLDADAMAWLDGYLYAADSEAGVIADLYRINPLTGSVVNLGSTGIFGLNGLMAVETAVVPLPGAALLGILGLSYSSWRLRRWRTV